MRVLSCLLLVSASVFADTNLPTPPCSDFTATVYTAPIGTKCESSFPGRFFLRVGDPKNSDSLGWKDLSENGKIWFDRTPDQLLSYSDAIAFCEAKPGQTLPTGYRRWENGKFGFPSVDSDFENAYNHSLFSLYPDIGASVSGVGSWSQSIVPNRPNLAYAFMIFHFNTYPISVSKKLQVHCVSQ